MPEFDDAWYEDWKSRMEEHGNVILALGLRPTALAPGERVVMEMPMSRNVRQGTGVFAAGALMQLADVGATMLCQSASGTPEAPGPFPLSVQISVNLVRNVDHGKAISESVFLHRGRTMMVVESKVRDEDGRLLCVVTSTHTLIARAPEASGG